MGNGILYFHGILCHDKNQHNSPYKFVSVLDIFQFVAKNSGHKSIYAYIYIIHACALCTVASRKRENSKEKWFAFIDFTFSSVFSNFAEWLLCSSHSDTLYE